MMKIDILTLFPEMVNTCLSESIIGRARKNGKLNINCINIRDYTLLKHGHVDDSPYGGGRGMVMAVQPVLSALESVKQEGVNPYVVYMSPQGKVFNQEIAKELLKKEATLCLYGDRITIDGTAYSFEELGAITLLGKNKLNVYTDNDILQLKGSKRFNALKYVHFYHRWQNIRIGGQNDAFLGL